MLHPPSLSHLSNATNEELVICVNCNHQSPKICTKKLSLQQPMDDNLVMTWKDFLSMGKKHCMKTLACDKNVVYCIISKAQRVQVKLHRSKVLQTIKTPPKKSKISAPSAVVIRG